MIPFKRVFEEKRRLVIPVAAGLALNVILYVGVVYPLGARVRATEQRDRVAARELADAEREDRAARDLVQGKARTDAALQTFYRDVLPTSLAGARGMTYLHLAQLAERHNLKSSHRSADAEANPQGPLQRLRLTMALEGNYDDVRRFVYELETGSEFIVIDGVTLTQGGEAGAPLQLTLALSTYYRHGA
jgi:Type II secretion system (T2SS), protein M subtype b